LFGLVSALRQEEAAMFFNTYGFENISSDELRNKIERGEDFLLLDVRTPMEHASRAIVGSSLLPVQELNFRVNELPKDREIVVYCQVGNRSAFAAAYLARLGYKVKNLEGGILSWARNGKVAYARA
jgi:rhodanese-related sulfurtransferase